jgi:signal peptidase II
MTHTQKYLILFSILIVGVSLDQYTKQLVLDRFLLGESLPVITGFFDLSYVQNRGAAFGFLSQADPRFRVPFFIVIPLVALT